MKLAQALPQIISDTLPGPKAKAVLKGRAEYVPQGVSCDYPVVIDKGAGAMLQDVDGNLFLDWVGGVGVLNVGYSQPEVTQAIVEQADRFLHGMVNIVTHQPYVQLAKELSELASVRGTQGNKAFFANSGAETMENGIKIAKSYTKRENIIVFSRAFHGRTMLTMSMTAKKSYGKSIRHVTPGVFRAEYPYAFRSPVPKEEQLNYYVQNLRNVFEEGVLPEDVAAIVLEPVQGEGGFIPAPLDWIKEVRKICDHYGILLLADEIQTGFGRTGKLFASEYWEEVDALPDIIVTAKSIAAGLPLGAVIARKEIMDSVPKGVIGGTFGGNAVACAAGLAVLQVMEEQHLIERSKEIGEVFRETMEELKKDCPIIGEVRGLGGMLGVEFVEDMETKEPATEFVSQLISSCAQKGLIIENAGIYGNVVRFLAPLVITDQQLACGLAIFTQTIKELAANEPFVFCEA